MHSKLRILFVDDEAADIDCQQRELERSGLAFTARIVASEPELKRQLIEFNPDVVLCDYTMGALSGLRALEIIQALRTATPVLMISGSIIEDTAIECLTRGATDYVLKSNLRRLGPAVHRAAAEARRQAQLQNRIEQLSHYDTLTGLPNLSLINQIVCRAIERGRDSQALMAVVVLNLDRFRFVDEGLGRRMADSVLKDISAVLLAHSGSDDAVARIGADEFMLVLAGFQDVSQISPRVQLILELIARPRTLAGRQLNVAASAGIAIYPSHGTDFESLVSRASAALHVAKTMSPGGIQIHSDDVTRRAQRHWRLEQDLHQALERKELSLFYQAQFEVASGKLCGIEALARWFRADGEAIPPSVFIPMAEQNGMIDALGSWALRAGCAAAASWRAVSISAPICINVSALQICERFTCEIAAALEANSLQPQQLELEITESVLVANPDVTLSALAQWKSLGVRIAVDDFGTGFSGLRYLSKLPIDRLKIDGSFVQGICEDSTESTVVRAVVSLGKELGFTVLAEGVETPQQLRMLGELGCQQAQGFLLGRPLPAAEAHRLMQAQRAQHRPVRNATAHQWTSKRIEPRRSL